jgi:hypothetical protein
MPAGFGLTLVLFSHDILMVISPDEPCLKRLARAFGFLYSYFTVLQILLFLTDLFFFALEMEHSEVALSKCTLGAGQHPPVDPGDILASPPLRLLVSELACAHRGHPYSLPRAPRATEPLHGSAAGSGATGATGGSGGR